MLYISPVAVRKHIDNLEKEYGVVLFERNSKGVVLTEKGVILYNYVIKFKEIYGDCLKELKKTINKEIKIGVSRNFLLGSSNIILNLFLGYNKNQVSIIEMQESYNFVKNNLNKLGNEADIIIGNVYSMMDSKFNQVEICKNKQGLLVPNRHELYNNKSISIKDLDSYKVYYFDEYSNKEINKTIQILKKNSNVEIIKKCSNLTIAYEKCIKENALLLCTNYLKTNFEKAVIIPLSFAMSVPFSMVCLKDSEPYIKEFMTYIKQNINSL